MHIETININFPAGQSAISRAFIEALLRGPELNESEDHPAPEAMAVRSVTGAVPRIGEAWPEHGGIYAGVSRGEDGAPDAHIVLLDATPAEELNWADAVKWAEGLGNGSRLPTRFESALLYANVRDKLNTDSWYWTGTQCSGNSAFYQYFDNGNQNYNSKSYEGRARAVRRLAL
jgi:hypothetical protein